MLGTGAGAGAAIGSVIPGLGTAVGALIGAGVGGIGALLSGTQVGKALSDAWDWTKEKAGDLWDSVSSWGSKTWGNIKTWAGNTWDNVKSKASDMWDGAKKFGIDAFNTAVGVGDIAMENLFNAMGLDWGDFKTKVSEGWNNIKEWGTETWTNISSWAGEKWDWISEKASGIWDGISTKATEIWTGITDWAGEKWDWVSEKAGGIWEGITDFASDSWDSIKTTAGDVWDGISKKASDVWDGVKKGATKAFDAVKDKAGDIWGGIKDFFSGAKSRGESITGIDGSHKTGLDSVPKDGYIAELHKDEAVLTAEQARQWRAEQNASRSTGFFHNVWKNAKLDKEALIQSYKNAMSAASSGSSTSGSGDYSNIQVDGTGKDSVWKILRSMGYSKAATAGIMGNMQQESGVNPSAIQGNGRGPAAGIVQWENYNTKSARWASMAQYASSKGKEWTDLQSQLEYLDKEMRGADSTTLSLLKKKVGGYDQFKALTDIDKATLVFEESFERAGTPMMSNRYSAARQFYDQFNSYDTGTPWVPNDQIALIHKGEMIVPASANPVNNSSNSGSEDSTIDDLIQVVKWGVSRIEKAITNSNQSSGYNLANMTRTRKDTASDEVFSFAST
jgi:gas vesicle protein